jgi:hypothetical protein
MDPAIHGTTDCPGERRSYTCTVLTALQHPQLTWIVNLPGSSPVEITYNGSSPENSLVRHSASFSHVLKRYSAWEYIESTIIFTVVEGVLLDRGTLECHAENLTNVTTMSFDSYRKLAHTYTIATLTSDL